MLPAVNNTGYKFGHFLRRNCPFCYYFNFILNREIIHWRIEADIISEDVLQGESVSVLWCSNFNTEAAILTGKNKVKFSLCTLVQLQLHPLLTSALNWYQFSHSHPWHSLQPKVPRYLSLCGAELRTCFVACRFVNVIIDLLSCQFWYRHEKKQVLPTKLYCSLISRQF